MIDLQRTFRNRKVVGPGHAGDHNIAVGHYGNGLP